jgi:hypothetical protein
MNPELNYDDESVYDALVDMNHEQLVYMMLREVEADPSITLLDFCKKFDYNN